MGAFLYIVAIISTVPNPTMAAKNTMVSHNVLDYRFISLINANIIGCVFDTIQLHVLRFLGSNVSNDSVRKFPSYGVQAHTNVTPPTIALTLC